MVFYRCFKEQLPFTAFEYKIFVADDTNISGG